MIGGTVNTVETEVELVVVGTDAFPMTMDAEYPIVLRSAPSSKGSVPDWIPTTYWEEEIPSLDTRY